MSGRLEFTVATDRGRHRGSNEDRCIGLAESGVFCVADGMGGAAEGELASEAIVNQITEVFRTQPPSENEAFEVRVRAVREAIQRASRWIRQYADEKLLGQMGSTVVSLVVDPGRLDRAVILHAGDSRLYRYVAGHLELLTRDHTTGEMIAAKSGQPLAEIPARLRNELTRAVGIHKSVELTETAMDVAPGSLFLLCSDGLTRMVEDQGIETILREGELRPIRELAQQLIDRANQAGGRDNITVVMVRVRRRDTSDGGEGALQENRSEEASTQHEGGTQAETTPQGSDGSPMAEHRNPDLVPQRQCQERSIPGRRRTCVGRMFPGVAIGMLTLVIFGTGAWLWRKNSSPVAGSSDGRASVVGLRSSMRMVEGLPSADIVPDSPMRGRLGSTHRAVGTLRIEDGAGSLTGSGKASSMSKDVHVRFEQMLVWFGCVRPSDVVLLTHEARGELPFTAPISPVLRDQCFGDLLCFETEFPSEVVLRRHYAHSNLVNLLRRAIHEWPVERRF